MKGGKNGEVILPGKAGESELMKRLLLERQEEHHMPPKEKPQLNDDEMALIHWWIATGASFDKKVKDADQPEKLKPVLLALQKEEENTERRVLAEDAWKANMRYLRAGSTIDKVVEVIKYAIGPKGKQ